MDISDKVAELRDIIDNTLKPLIKGDYILLDVPYYQNIGDVLIWCGTESFLKQLPYNCLYRTSCTCYEPKKISKEVTILLQGGGNFGDLWHPHQEFRNKIINTHPDNPIVILPQTVFYKDETKILEDAALYQKHPNLTICARDKKSYEILKKYFKNNVCLVPDMAFYIDVQIKTNKTGRSLFLKRTDKELKITNGYFQSLPQNVEIHDWPTYESSIKVYSINYVIGQLLTRIDNKLSSNLYKLWNDFYNNVVIRRYCLCVAKSFISKYDVIYSTRLHPAIMGVLLGKKVNFIDNSYGKNLNFYYSWLENLDNIQMINSNGNK